MTSLCVRCPSLSVKFQILIISEITEPFGTILHTNVSSSSGKIQCRHGQFSVLILILIRPFGTRVANQSKKKYLFGKYRSKIISYIVQKMHVKSSSKIPHLIWIRWKNKAGISNTGHRNKKKSLIQNNTWIIRRASRWNTICSADFVKI